MGELSTNSDNVVKLIKDSYEVYVNRSLNNNQRNN